ELTKVPPKVDVCERRYVFNQTPIDGQTFNPTGTCPATTQPESLMTAYSAYQSTYEAAFNRAIKGSFPAPKPTIAGIQEAKVVSEWSRKRARGERVPVEPPSMNADGTISTTARMGRIDSPAGRRQAALDAEKAAKQRAAEQKAAQLAAAREAARAPSQASMVPLPESADAAPVAETQTAQSDGPATKLKKKLLGMFGG